MRKKNKSSQINLDFGFLDKNVIDKSNKNEEKEHFDILKNKKKNSKQMNLHKILDYEREFDIIGDKKSITFVKKFEKFCIKHSLIKNKAKIIIGISGGSDSIAMLYCLNYIKFKYNLSLLAVHINYNLRGKESEADEEFVKNICSRKNILYEVFNVELSKNNENNFRKLRYDFFEKVALKNKTKYIAVAHNKEDHVETVFLNFIRGASFNGLKGIPPKKIKRNKLEVIRPMLAFEKNEILKFLEFQKTKEDEIIYRTDSSNLKEKYTRNKIRLSLIPWIKKNLNPNIEKQIYRFAGSSEDVDNHFRKLVKSGKKNLQIRGKSTEKVLCYNISKLKKESNNLLFYLFRQIYFKLCGTEKNFYMSNFEQIRKILYSKGSKHIILPGNIRIEKIYDEIYFTKEENYREKEPDEPLLLPKISKLFIYGNYRLTMARLKVLPLGFNKDEFTVYLDYDKIKFPILVRHPMVGDKFEPLGMEKGTKKLKNFFIDRKVPKFERKNLILISDSSDILWVVGHRLSRNAKITDKTKNFLYISVENIEKARYASRINNKGQ